MVIYFGKNFVQKVNQVRRQNLQIQDAPRMINADTLKLSFSEAVPERQRYGMLALLRHSHRITDCALVLHCSYACCHSKNFHISHCPLMTPHRELKSNSLATSFVTFIRCFLRHNVFVFISTAHLRIDYECLVLSLQLHRQYRLRSFLAFCMSEATGKLHQHILRRDGNRH